jgi:hypothetical protein
MSQIFAECVRMSNESLLRSMSGPDTFNCVENLAISQFGRATSAGTAGMFACHKIGEMTGHSLWYRIQYMYLLVGKAFAFYYVTSAIACPIRYRSCAERLRYVYWITSGAYTRNRVPSLLELLYRYFVLIKLMGVYDSMPSPTRDKKVGPVSLWIFCFHP